MKKLTLALCAALTTTVGAMQPLEDSELQAVEAQAGADLSLKLSLNHKFDGSKYVFDNGVGGVCADEKFCRLAIAINKRYVRETSPNSNVWIANSTSGNKLWMVMKGIQGTIHMQRLGIDGQERTYKNDANQDVNKSALQLSFDNTKPILIRNFGFNALAIERDNFSSTAADPSNVADYGYLKYSVYQQNANPAGTPAIPTGATAVNVQNSLYDHGKETGFLGLRMNGDMVMQGKIQVFGCDSGHSRC